MTVIKDPLADLLGPGLARHLADIDRIDRQVRDVERLTRPLLDTGLSDLVQLAAQADPAMELARKNLLAGATAESLLRVTSHCNDVAQAASIDFYDQLDVTALAARSSLADEVARSIHPAIAELHDHYHTLIEQFSTKATLETSSLASQVTQSIDAIERQIAPALNPPEFLFDLVQQLNQSSLWDAVGEIEESPSWLSADLQQAVTEAVSQQPSWRQLIDQLTNPDGESSETIPLEALERDLVVAYHQTLPDKERPAQPQQWSKADRLIIVLMIIGLLLELYQCEPKKKSDHLPEQPRVAAQLGRWDIHTQPNLVLRLTPRRNGQIVLRPKLGTVLIERRRNGNWIEVEASPCEGEPVIGWIHSEDLEGLSSSDRDLCPAPADDASHDEPSVPMLIVEAGPAAIDAWQEFFLAQLVNPHTRSSYQRACRRFLDRCDSQDIRLTAIRPTHVAQWRDLLLKTHSPTTVKQHMSAVKRLFDWLQLRDIINSNPVQPVRPPRLTRRKARSPALKPAEVVRLFDAIDDETVTDFRDRAALAIMTFNLARVSAVAHLKVDDVDLEGTEPTIRLLEKRGQELLLPLNPTVASWISDYLVKAGIAEKLDSPLFRSLGKGGGQGQVTERGLSRQDLHAMTRRRFARADIRTTRICHALRATGITMLLLHNVPIEIVSQLAGHSSIATTQQYDQRDLHDMRQAMTRLSGNPG